MVCVLNKQRKNVTGVSFLIFFLLLPSRSTMSLKFIKSLLRKKGNVRVNWHLSVKLIFTNSVDTIRFINRISWIFSFSSLFPLRNMFYKSFIFKNKSNSLHTETVQRDNQKKCIKALHAHQWPPLFSRPW